MFLTKFMKAGVIDEDNKQVLSEIELVEQACSDFKLECREIGGKWGLWLNISVGQLLVRPLELVSSLYNDDWSFMNILSEGKLSRCEVSIRKTNYSYEWTILNIELSLYCVLHFKFVDYVGKTRVVMNDLLEIYNKGLESAYSERDEGAEMHKAIEMCCKQLQIEALYPSHYKLMTDKVCEESFVFNSLSDHEEHFEIGIGKRSYKTWMSRWDFELETFRHNFETLILTHESSINITFDTSNTTLQVKFVNVLDKIKKVGPGFGFEYKEYALVKILPNEFVNMPIIAGYCDRKQFVKTLYEGLLRLALQYPLESDGDENTFEAYAKIKSPLVEQYIRGEEREYHMPQQRDAHIKDVILINPDYDSWGDSLISDRAPLDINRNGVIESEDIYDNDGKSIVIPELHEWQQEIKPIIIASESGEPYEKDWADYHRRGLEIAHKLRKELSRDFDLWYGTPFEDKSGSVPQNILIL